MSTGRHIETGIMAWLVKRHSFIHRKVCQLSVKCVLCLCNTIAKPHKVTATPISPVNYWGGWMMIYRMSPMPLGPHEVGAMKQGMLQGMNYYRSTVLQQGSQNVTSFFFIQMPHSHLCCFLYFLINVWFYLLAYIDMWGILSGAGLPV